MPILDLQARTARIGQIRMGTSVAIPGKKGRRPVKLSTLRFTSASERAITAVAQQYGGEPKPWTENAPSPGLWEVITEAPEVAVACPPGEQLMTANYELWEDRRRLRLCDSQTDGVSGGPCVCKPEARACKPYTRLSVMLPDVPGLGVWVLNSTGLNAAVGMMGVAQQLQQYATRGQILPAMLRLEHRVSVDDRTGETLRFVVPVLELTMTLREIAGGAASEQTLYLPPPPPRLLALTRSAEPPAEGAVPAEPARATTTAPAPATARPPAPQQADRPAPTQGPAKDPARPIDTGSVQPPSDAQGMVPIITACESRAELAQRFAPYAEKAGWMDDFVTHPYSDEMWVLLEVFRARDAALTDAES
jgi:hypothetical protein